MVYWYVVIVGTVAAFPANWVDKQAETNSINNLENFISKYDPYPFDFDLTENVLPVEDIEPVRKNVQIIAKRNKSESEKTSDIPFSEVFIEKPKNDTKYIYNLQKNSNETTNKPNETLLTRGELDPVFDKNSTGFNDTGRIPRQETFNETNTSKEKESQEESSEEEEGGNMITGLLSAFLGGLSRPDGSIDLEAIVGLLGSLSTQYPNGTYEFNGLTELLRSFFGGGDEGGSDVGAFAGGILGAVIKGLANPPGSKGAGIFTGKVVAGLLPALSGPAMDGDMKAPQLDAGGFLTGFLKPIFSSSAGGGKGGSKFAIIKTVISLLTSLLSGASSAASSLSSKSDWAQTRSNDWTQGRAG